MSKIVASSPKRRDKQTTSKRLLKAKNTTKSNLRSFSDLSEDLVSIGNTFTQVKRLLCQAILTAFDWGVWTHYVICCLCRSLQTKQDSRVNQLLTIQHKKGKKQERDKDTTFVLEPLTKIMFNELYH